MSELGLGHVERWSGGEEERMGLRTWPGQAHVKSPHSRMPPWPKSLLLSGAEGQEHLALRTLQVSEQETQDYSTASCPDPGFLEE